MVMLADPDRHMDESLEMVPDDEKQLREMLDASIVNINHYAGYIATEPQG
jgi:hypothetical protein